MLRFVVSVCDRWVIFCLYRLDGLGPNAYEAFQASRDLRAVVNKVKNVKDGSVKGELTRTVSVGAHLMTPIQPMLVLRSLCCSFFYFLMSFYFLFYCWFSQSWKMCVSLTLFVPGRGLSIRWASISSLSKRHVRRDQVWWRTRPATQEGHVVQIFQSQSETRPTTQGFLSTEIYLLSIAVLFLDSWLSWLNQGRWILLHRPGSKHCHVAIWYRTVCASW